MLGPAQLPGALHYGLQGQSRAVPKLSLTFASKQVLGAGTVVTSSDADLAAAGDVTLQAAPGSSRGIPRTLGRAGAGAGSCAAAAVQPARLLHPQGVLRVALPGPCSTPHQVLPAMYTGQRWLSGVL